MRKALPQPSWLQTVYSSVGLLVVRRLLRRAVGADSLKGALVPLYLADGGHLISGTTELPSA